VINTGRLRSLGYLCRMLEQDPCRKLTLRKPEPIRPAVVRWLDSVEEDLKVMGVRNWRGKS
jgi:hypothetical protein